MNSNCQRKPKINQFLTWLVRIAVLFLLAFAPGAIAYDSNSWNSQIQQAASQNGIDPALLKAVVKQESGFNPNAQSGAGAIGLAQLMPGTAKQYGASNPWDPQQNLDAAAKFLSHLENKYNGNTDLVLAAYNAGEGNVAKYGNRIPPFAETQKYVQNVEKYYQQYGGNINDSNPTQAASGQTNPGQSSAGGPPSPEGTTGPKLELDNFFEKLFNELNTLSQGIANKLNADGANLASVLALIAVMWTAIKAVLKQDAYNKLIAELVEVILISAVALMLVQSSFYEQLIHQPLDNTFCQVAAKFSGSDAQNCRQMSSSVRNLTGGLTLGMQNIWHSIVEEIHAITLNSDKGALETVKNWVTALAHPGKYALLAALVLVDALAKLVVIALLLWAMVLCFITYCGSVIMADIGFALGPIFIPWIILQKHTSIYCKTWAAFIIGAEMYRVMAVLIMSIGTPLIEWITNYACRGAGAKSCNDITVASSPVDVLKLMHDVDIPLLIIAYLLAYFMKHAGPWAEGLVSKGAALTRMDGRIM